MNPELIPPCFTRKAGSSLSCGLTSRLDAALGNAAQLRQPHGKVISGHGHRLAVEIAAQPHFLGIRKNQRVGRG
jgi:hypothetical protein